MKKMIFNVLLLLTIEGFAKGFYIPQNQNENRELNEDHVKRNSGQEDPSKFGDILNFWSTFKDKLKGDNSKDNDEKYSMEKDTFNELEILQMIPLIIDNYRTNQITTDEKLNLSKTYGNLWTIIEQEAERKQSEEEMNPLLKALFDSFHLTKDTTNDIDHNTVMEVTKKPPRTSSILQSGSTLSRKLFLNVNKSDHPSQRLLNVAAMLIHQAMHGRRSQQSESVFSSGASLVGTKRRPYKILLPSSRKATLNLKLTDIPIEQITRTKRNVKIHFSGNSDSHDAIQNSRIDALLRIFKGQNGIENEGFDSDDENGDDEDYFSHDNRKNYFYDDFYEDEEEAHDENLESSENAGDDDAEYGSFQDLMLLAERHRLRREMEEDRLRRKESSRSLITSLKLN